FGNGHSRVRFAQEADDLFFGESFLHIQSPCVVDWTLKSCATQYRGDVAMLLGFPFTFAQRLDACAIWTDPAPVR
ncbi:hypothetical protein, partial [Chromobacterium violaceum]|uniref:hypothetical protein n=1 Tax=Chromobacterium violaceum TaxID=536 RepID=UPI001B33F6D6